MPDKSLLANIPAGAFSQQPGNNQRPNSFAKYSACDLILRDTLVALGNISSWRLGKLLGMRWPNNLASAWLSGRRRPSQLYCVRLVRLHQLAIAGVNFVLIDEIDWDSGEFVYKKNLKGERLRGPAQVMPAVVKQRRDAMSEFLSKLP